MRKQYGGEVREHCTIITADVTHQNRLKQDLFISEFLKFK